MEFTLTAEQRLFQQTVHDFVAAELRARAAEVDERAEFNWDAVRKMGPLGLLGLNASEEYGGSGADALSAVIALEELGWGCGSTALAVAAHNGLACAPLNLFGTHAQKSKFLRPLASGTGRLGALALTEPGAGSDLAGGIKTVARRDGDHWLLNGEKMWTTNASLSDVIIVLARTNVANGTLSMLIVPAGVPGLEVGPPERKMGLRGSPTHAVRFTDVRLPADHLLGQEGRGLQQTLVVLDGGRVGIAALCIGLAQAAYEESVRYAAERRTFGSPIAAHQAIQHKLADMATEIRAARLLVWKAAWEKQRERRFSQSAALAKLFASEMSERVCYQAIQIHGGYGYSSAYPVERIYRDQRLMAIGEGTSEILRIVIARTILN